MKQGLVTKVAVTPANINEDKAFKHIAPKQRLVYMDKQYATKEVARLSGCDARTIKKNNQKHIFYALLNYMIYQIILYTKILPKIFCLAMI